MVFFFTSNVVKPEVTLFVGLDKYENEELIRWGWPEDVWFHVANLSSAHVYLRLKPGQSIHDIPDAIIRDAAQLCKANSITGNKTNNVDVNYTMWSNLKKTAGMEPGQVSFFREKEVYKIHIEKRSNEIVNRLNKTKVEKKYDLKESREARDAEERNKEKAETHRRMLREKQDEERRKKEASLRSYDNMFDSSRMTSNASNLGQDEDDFM